MLGQFSMKDSTESAEPGNYGVGFPNFLGKVEDPEARKSKLAAELANGRLAMMVARNFFGGETTSYASFDPATELGVQDPIGFWDPLGLSADKDQATFKRRRAVEIKHGRIAPAMYATMGYIVPEYFKFPGYLIPVLGGAQIIAFCGLIETTGFFQASSTTDGRGPREGQFSMKDSTESAEPGNYGVGFPNFLGKVEDPEARKSKLAAELANGRLAMMAIIGMFFQDGLTGSAWGDWSLYTASPLRARESKVARNFFGGETTSYASFDPATELGVQDPIGFWDPLGLSADKDQATFKRRRAVEIKHGRIAMYATMGYIVPEYFKFPGYLSPSLGLKFSDVPNGLAALSKIPVLGGAQIIAFCGLIETTGFFQASSTTDGRGPREGQFSMKDSTESAEPGNYGVGFPNFLGKVEDPEVIKMTCQVAERAAILPFIFAPCAPSALGASVASGAVVTAAVAARNAGKHASKTTRHFFGDSGGSSYASFDPATELGVQDPIGFWDPLGLSADKDQATFKRRRAVEIKHGRIAMYATMGYIVPEYFKFPGYLSPSLGLKFSDVPNGLAALSKIPVLGGAQIIAFCGLIETTGFFQASSTTDGRGPREGQFSMKDSTESAEPGNYGVGFPNFLGKVEDPEARKSKLAAELANGRLAMMAIIGMFFQDGLTGSAWGDWSLYTASPLRARESKVALNFFGGETTSYASFDPATELGVQDPIGFWDPLGLSADKDQATFKRRRAVEIKHGRIAMYATMGYIVPEYFKFPGYLSPSLGLKFSDVPNGLAALSKPRTTGFFQASSTTDGRGPREGQFSMKDSTESAEPGNYGVGFPNFLGKVEDPEARKSKLAAELANGRLAMMVARNFFGGETTSYASFDPATELGVQDPIGFWDPLGLSADKDQATFKRRRAVEIKHGRIAMYATMGYIVPEYFKFPGYLSPSLGLKFSDVPNGLAALSKIPVLGGAQIIAFCGLIETTGFFQASSTTDGRGPREGQFSMKDSTESAEPGNYGVGFPNFLGKVEDPEARKSKLAAELANGRLAMMVARSFFGGETTSYASFDPATELGVQDPIGFWDPLGLSADKDQATFKRRRAVEIKHGRIAMYATMGYIVPEYFKFPGYLIPVLGGAQIIAFCGLIETTGFFQASSTTDGRGPREGQFSMKDSTESAEPGNYGVGFPNFLGKVEDPEARKSKLAAELANGRLAMMAIIGMFFQDGLTGSAWGDWSLYTASPLRARESKVARNFFGGETTSYASFDPATELGVQDPIGVAARHVGNSCKLRLRCVVIALVGLSADKDQATFKRRRAVEIKHGRIAPDSSRFKPMYIA
ncbi:FCPF [Symbiodinium sp. CCMP2592]|nr:FCPF [Symbiodinium sp. CCMP2592]